MRLPTLFVPMMLIAALLAGSGAWAMPGNAPATPAAPAAKGEALVVTLEYPPDSPHLEGLALPAPESRNLLQRLTGPATVRYRVPVTSEAYAALPLAVVDDEPLTLADFRFALAPAMDAEGENLTVDRQDPAALLERLIDSRVIVREGEEMGLDQLPEVREMVDVFRRRTLREMLAQRYMEKVTADPAEVERLFQEAIREYRIKALVFQDEKEAQSFAKKAAAGQGFDEEAEKLVAAGKAQAKGGTEGETVRQEAIMPEVAKALDALAPGGVTGVLPMEGEGGFAVIMLLDARRVEDPHARERAEQRALNFARNKAMVDYNHELTERYVKLDKKLFESLDFEGEFDRLLEDQRVVAEVAGEAPLTVAELTEGVKDRYYHGVKRAIKTGKVDSGKVTVLNDLLYKRVFVKEAQALKLDQTEEFRRKLEEYRQSVIFGAFMQKALVPEVKVTMDEIRAYYKEHEADYSYPEMMGIHALAFTTPERAGAALTKLNQGVAFKWLESNAEGQLARGTPGTLDFGESLVSTKTFPAELRKVLDRAQAGDARLYGDGKGHYYVLYVDKVVPAQVQPLEEVQSVILKAVFDRKLQAALKEWTQKLRQSYPVEVFAREFNASAL